MANQGSNSYIKERLDFFKQSYAELKKVQTPSREETWRATLSVLLMVALFGLFLGLTDKIAGVFVRWLLAID
ncbi:MAG TPA: preprotein translocase subunit SecE [Oligoflexia bacterium]|nr:preprotein translocase subunit SecE [Oligoflexia bacterium]HMP48024.1 preprotein translocase subunit SecE [Oligoflexia bacterium]